MCTTQPNELINIKTIGHDNTKLNQPDSPQGSQTKASGRGGGGGDKTVLARKWEAHLKAGNCQSVFSSQWWYERWPTEGTQHATENHGTQMMP